MRAFQRLAEAVLWNLPLYALPLTVAAVAVGVAILQRRRTAARPSPKGGANRLTASELAALIWAFLFSMGTLAHLDAGHTFIQPLALTGILVDGIKRRGRVRCTGWS